MRKYAAAVFLMPLIVPALALAQGLFAFKGAAPATGGFNQTSIVAPPLQATLQEVPSLEGPYGNELPSLSELGETEPKPKSATASNATAEAPPANAAPAVSLRPRLNPLRAPVREKRKVRRFIRRLLTLPSEQDPQVGKRQNISSLRAGTPVP